MSVVQSKWPIRASSLNKYSDSNPSTQRENWLEKNLSTGLNYNSYSLGSNC